MTITKKAVSFILILTVLMSVSTIGFADNYDLSLGSITITGTDSTQTVSGYNLDKQAFTNESDSNPIIEQNSDSTTNNIILNTTAGDVNITLSGINYSGTDQPSSPAICIESTTTTPHDANITVSGENNIELSRIYISSIGGEPVYYAGNVKISGENSDGTDTLTITGDTCAITGIISGNLEISDMTLNTSDNTGSAISILDCSDNLTAPVVTFNNANINIDNSMTESGGTVEIMRRLSPDTISESAISLEKCEPYNGEAVVILEESGIIYATFSNDSENPCNKLEIKRKNDQEEEIEEKEKEKEKIEEIEEGEEEEAQIEEIENVSIVIFVPTDANGLKEGKTFAFNNTKENFQSIIFNGKELVEGIDFVFSTEGNMLTITFTDKFFEDNGNGAHAVTISFTGVVYSLSAKN